MNERENLNMPERLLHDCMMNKWTFIWWDHNTCMMFEESYAKLFDELRQLSARLRPKREVSSKRFDHQTEGQGGEV